MGEASYLISSFIGGEISKSAQGRYDLPAYKTQLNVCLNAFPIETAAWSRRSGTVNAGTTRGGGPGRVIDFSVNQASPLTIEFTDLFMRFRMGTALVTTNDAVAISSITADNPAKVNTATAHVFSTGNTTILPGINVALLQNRAFLITKTSATQFTIADAITGAGIDGATLTAFTTGSAARLLELATNYGAGSWGNVRSVQAESQTVLLNGTHPQVLTMATPPSPIAQPTFALAASNFLDGPYLDPFPGSIVTYSATVGNITLTFSFAAYDATVSYNVGDYVLSGGVGYKSLINANLNNNPVASPTAWVAVPGGAPVGPNGFTAADIGRHIRLFSEPAAWAVGTAYTLAAKTVVKFNGAYYRVTADSTGVTPGTDATKWAVVTGAQYALWTWGRVLSVSGSGLIAPSVAIGNYTALAAAFDGTVSKGFATSANKSVSTPTYPQWVQGGYNAGDRVYYAGGFYQANATITVFNSPGTVTAGQIVVETLNTGHYYKALVNGGVTPPPNPPGNWQDLGGANPTNTSVWTFVGTPASVSLDVYAGQDFHAAPQAIVYATIFGSTDYGYGFNLPAAGVTFNLRAKHTAPASASDGTIIGTTGAISNTLASLTINSTDTATAWEYVWVEMKATQNPPLADPGSHSFSMFAYLAQAEFFANNVANGSVVTIQLAGPALLYAAGAVVNTWRAGVYSDGTGWPTCGTYHEGRLWLAGVVNNRLDASVSNSIFNFAPTGPDGTVAANNAISYTFNSPDVNSIFWMVPDLQGIICGTQAGEWLVQATTANLPLAPANIQAHRVTTAKCANVEPRRSEHTLLVVQARKRKIMEYFADVFSGKFTAPNLTDKARHLTGSQIQEIAYQQELTPTIWARCGDGSLFGMTYKRDTLMTSQGPTYCGAHRHTLGSGRLVESIAVGASQGGTLDALTMVTNDPATGIRHVEVLADFLEEGTAFANAWLLDDAVTPTSTASSSVTPSPYGGLTLNGLWHLNGKTVTVFAGGLDCGDYAVANGSVTVPYGDGVSAGTAKGLFTAAFVASFTTMPLVVGFTYNSDGQLLRPNASADTGARNGPGFGKLRRNHKYAVQTVNTAGLSIGTSFAKLDPVLFRSDAQASYADNQPFTGVHSGDNLEGAHDFDGQICWRISRPLPAMITAIGGFVQTSDQ